PRRAGPLHPLDRLTILRMWGLSRSVADHDRDGTLMFDLDRRLSGLPAAIGSWRGVPRASRCDRMVGNFRERLWAREALIGTMVTLPLPAIAEILADLGFDWLFVDGEHGPLEAREILAILQAVGDRVPCLVRVPGAEEPPIKRALDLGAEGIIVPQVNTAEQAAGVVRFARYA